MRLCVFLFTITVKMKFVSDSLRNRIRFDADIHIDR